jgi:hypothetical protein
MTDRIKGFVVTLTDDIRIDDVQPLLDAVKMLKGVASVDTSVTDMDDHMNRRVIAMEMKTKIYEVLKELG